jgi:hypothetical protein
MTDNNILAELPTPNFDLERSLYILSVLRITAVFISHHLGPVIPTSAKLKKGIHSRLHMWDILLALA